MRYTSSSCRLVMPRLAALQPVDPAHPTGPRLIHPLSHLSPSPALFLGPLTR